MKYAVISISGSQYKIEENQTITVNNLDLKENETATTDQVLLLVNDGSVEIGNPVVKGASVEYQVIKNHKGDKVRVFKYKSKSRYRKTQGFRAQLTDVKILKINK